MLHHFSVRVHLTLLPFSSRQSRGAAGGEFHSRVFNELESVDLRAFAMLMNDGKPFALSGSAAHCLLGNQLSRGLSVIHKGSEYEFFCLPPRRLERLEAELVPRKGRRAARSASFYPSELCHDSLSDGSGGGAVSLKALALHCNLRGPPARMAEVLLMGSKGFEVFFEPLLLKVTTMKAL